MRVFGTRKRSIGRLPQLVRGRSFLPILDLQPCDKAAMLAVKTIQLFLE